MENNKKKLLLIKPSYTNGLWGIDIFKMLPQSLMNLGSLVLEKRTNWNVEVLDNNFETIDYNLKVDLVGISINTSQANKGYKIADKFRSKGVPVILGGIHATYCFDEAKQHADCVVKGEAEGIFLSVLDDFENKNLKDSYNGGIVEDLSIIPRQHFELFSKYNYSMPNIVQATRGCPINCDFCSVTKFNGSKIRFRPISAVVDDIKNIKKYGKKYFGRTGFFFADDNIFIDKAYAMELFKAIIPLEVRWGSQSSIYIARDMELLKLARQSGCRALLVGFESIYQDSLQEVHKKYNVAEYEKMIYNIHKAGIAVDASLIFGFENENESIVKETVNFLIRNEIELTQFSILTPYPGTKLYDKMVQNDLITNYNWDYYDQFHMVLKHKNWSTDSLNTALLEAYKLFYSYKSIYFRVRRAATRTNYKYGVFLAKMNWQYRSFNPN
jgi:radical SAM superfamily enzyme YgiQ (UPF0313 family)